jgi:DNA polymerase
LINWSQRCSLCPGNTNVVPGEGPLPCDACFIGEEPGYWENRRKRSFVGETGQELNGTYLPLCERYRPTIYITNAVKCNRLGNRKPSPREVGSCAGRFLNEELAACQPEVVVLMGATACSLVDEQDIDLEKHHGIVLRRTILGRDYWVFPTYHPAAGLRGMTVGGGDDEGGGPVPVMELLLQDFVELKKVLGGERSEPMDDRPRTDYELLRNPIGVAVQRAFEGNRPIAVDVETEGGRVYSIQWSCIPGVARMILAPDRECIRRFDELTGNARFILHNAPQDLDDLASIGIIPKYCEDTMQMAYRLQNQPQSLKRLAYRLCGMEMSSYNDLVMPYAREKVLEWLAEGIMRWPHEYGTEQVPPKVIEYVRKDGKRITSHRKGYGRKIEHRSPLQTELRRVFRAVRTSDGYSPWKRWGELEAAGGEKRDWVRLVEDELGPMPVPRISQVPLERVVEYGCGDADATLRCWGVLKEMVGGVGIEVREMDWNI